MKHIYTISFLSLCCVFAGFFINKQKPGDPEYIAPSKQRSGDVAAGYKYLTEGDYLKSGIPFNLFKMGFGKSGNDLGREGINKNIPYPFNAVVAPNGQEIVSPNCLQCHSQEFNGKIIIGMGNSLSDYTENRSSTAIMLARFLKAGTGKEADYAAAKNFIKSIEAVSPYLITEVKGVNVADRLAALLVAHRDPMTFQWSDSVLLPIPAQVIPTDVPAWWLLKKKHAMFYNGFGRGDFGRFLMASNLLTVSDTSESAEVDKHFGDVLAYIYSLKPPVYPQPIIARLELTARLGRRPLKIAITQTLSLSGATAK